MLRLPSWMNLDGKIEPVDIFSSIGMVYLPICALVGTSNLKGTGAKPIEDTSTLFGLNVTLTFE